MRASVLLCGFILLFLAACAMEGPAVDNTTVDTNDSAPVSSLPDNQTQANDTGNQTPAEDLGEDSGDYAAVVRGVEGEVLRLNTRATDPDGDEVALSFSAPFSENGTWQTQRGDAGEYEVEVTATDGNLTSTITVLAVVLPANQPPTISGPQSFSVQEGETVDLGALTITDPDGDEFIVSYAGWMSSSTYDTGFDDAGTHEVRVIAEDVFGNSAEETITVNVENVNRAPTLELERMRYVIVEGETVRVETIAEDPDGDDVAVEFEQPIDADGAWQTQEGDAGTYDVIVTASDGDEQVTRTVRIVVEPANRPPVIEVESTLTVREGQTVNLERAADIFDPEGENVTVGYSGWMETSTYTTDYNDAGSYAVTITAEDPAGNTAAETVTVVVEDVNRAPVFIRTA